MALITFIIRNTMDGNCFLEFAHLICFLCQYCQFCRFLLISALIQPKLGLLKALITKITKYHLDNVNNGNVYGSEPLFGVWALKMHYLGQYCRFTIFLLISAIIQPKFGLLKGLTNENDLIWR